MARNPLPFVLALLLGGAALAVPPATKLQPVTDIYHGELVVDPYRWLEPADDKAVQAWSDARNADARAFLAKLPGLAKVRARVKDALSTGTIRHTRLVLAGGQLFALKRQPPREQPFLVVMPSSDQPDKARVLLDPQTFDKKGTTVIDWFVPSPDGKLVAVSLSKAGSESGDVHIYDVALAKRVDRIVPRVQNGTAGGDLAWSPDGKGFFYTRYPRDKERPPADLDFYQQLYYHELGSDMDRYELGKDLPRIAEIRLQMHNPTGRLLVSVQNGDGGEFAHFVRYPNGKYRQFSAFRDRVVQAAFGPDGDLFIVARAGAPRGKVLRLDGKAPDVGKGKLVVPEGKETIVTDFWGKPTVLPTASRLYVIYQLGGPSELRVFDLAGKALPAPKQFPISTVDDLTPLTGDDILFANESFIEPLGQYAYRPRTNETVKTALTSGAVGMKNVRVVREFATSKDGTRVPVNILIPEGTKQDGSAACVANGYGGYGINITPSFRPERRVLLDAGVIFAVANLRGGGEYGEAWHKAGTLTRKQNVFDDFAAVLRYLISQRYTSSRRLGIMGGSNGGLLMGATLTQHPSLVKAVVSYVGIYDMLRVELSPNGAFNVPEFGTVKDLAQYKALRAYSPYYNVKDGVRYPATLLLTGAKDPRVDPMQSRKFAARLQAATASSAPILLRTSETAGHGLGTGLSERIAETTDVYAFLFAELGVR